MLLWFLRLLREHRPKLARSRRPASATAALPPPPFEGLETKGDMEGGSESSVVNDEVHVLKFNAAGVWSNVIIPSSADISKEGAAVTMTVDSTTSDVCLGLVAPGVATMNCQPGNPVAFLTLMWNVSHNRVYFLNHPLVPIGAGSAAGKHVSITYFKHAPVAPGSTFTLAVDAAVKTIRGLQGESVCFTLTPVSSAIVHGLGAFGFGLALSGANDRVHVAASFPLNVSDVRGKPDTLAFGDSAASTQAPPSAKRQMFDAVPVTVESVLPGFKIEPRYKGAAERRQHIEINEAYPGLKKIHSEPDIYEVQNFLTKDECEILMVSCWHVASLTTLWQIDHFASHFSNDASNAGEGQPAPNSLCCGWTSRQQVHHCHSIIRADQQNMLLSSSPP